MQKKMKVGVQESDNSQTQCSLFPSIGLRETTAGVFRSSHTPVECGNNNKNKNMESDFVLRVLHSVFCI